MWKLAFSSWKSASKLKKKNWLPDLCGAVKNFLSFQHPWCIYSKHSPRSELSNARCLMSVRHTQTKRHGVFWFTGVWKHFYSLKKPFSAYCYGKSTKITKMWLLQVFWGLKQVENIPDIILSCSKHLRNICKKNFFQVILTTKIHFFDSKKFLDFGRVSGQSRKTNWVLDLCGAVKNFLIF